MHYDEPDEPDPPALAPVQGQAINLELLYNLCARPYDNVFTAVEQRAATNVVWAHLIESAGDRATAITLLAWYADGRPPAAPSGVSAGIAFALGIGAGARARRAVRLLSYLGMRGYDRATPAQLAWSDAQLRAECVNDADYERLSSDSIDAEATIVARVLEATHRWSIDEPANHGAEYGRAWAISYMRLLCASDDEHERVVRAIIGAV